MSNLSVDLTVFVCFDLFYMYFTIIQWLYSRRTREALILNDFRLVRPGSSFWKMGGDQIGIDFRCISDMGGIGEDMPPEQKK